MFLTSKVRALGPRTLLYLNLSEAGRDISEFSEFSSAREILLEPNSRFRIVSHVDAGGDLTIVQCQQLPPRGSLLDPRGDMIRRGGSCTRHRRCVFVFFVLVNERQPMQSVLCSASLYLCEETRRCAIWLCGVRKGMARQDAPDKFMINWSHGFGRRCYCMCVCACSVS